MISQPKTKPSNRPFFTALALIIGVPLLLWCGSLYIFFHFVWKYW